MKSRQLCHLPLIHKLAQQMTTYCGIEKWNIGVNVICYRGHNDYIGYHSDDDQNESMILAIIPYCPDDMERKIIIQTKTRKGKNTKINQEECFEELELYLKAGDGYDMDGTYYGTS